MAGVAGIEPANAGVWSWEIVTTYRFLQNVQPTLSQESPVPSHLAILQYFGELKVAPHHTSQLRIIAN